MTRPIDTPAFWRQRFDLYERDPRRVLWEASDEAWDRMEQAHRTILASQVRPDDRILDAGCGYGRLLDLLPLSFRGVYVGVDVSPDMIEEARRRHPGHLFILGDLTELSKCLPKPPYGFDLAIGIMIYHMMITSKGEDYWQKVEAELNRMAERVLILEPREVL